MGENDNRLFLFLLYHPFYSPCWRLWQRITKQVSHLFMATSVALPSVVPGNNLPSLLWKPRLWHHVQRSLFAYWTCPRWPDVLGLALASGTLSNHEESDAAQQEESDEASGITRKCADQLRDTDDDDTGEDDGVKCATLSPSAK